MPVPINRATGQPWSIFGALKDFISPPGYTSRGPRGSLPAGGGQSSSGRPVGTQSVLGGKPVYWGGDNYGWQQLNQSGSSATLNSLNSPSAQGRFIQDQGYSPAAERAYQQEVSRVAQLTAQDPDLQRYEVARAAAKSQEEMNAVRDEGMRIWAQKHGGLAAKVKPGATGYEAIQAATGPVMPSALSNEQVQGVMSFDPNTVLSTTQNIQGQFRPNQQLTDQEILAAMSFDPNAALRSATNMAYAPMSPVEAAMLKEVGGAQGEYITPMNAVGSADQANLSFITPAEKRRQESSALFQELLNRANAKAR